MFVDLGGFAIEPYARGFIIADYSGERGKFGAAFCGKSEQWRDQPVISDPFSSIADAQAAVEAMLAARKGKGNG